MSTSLITGANGFIGQYLVEHLRQTSPDEKLLSVSLNPLTISGVNHEVCDLSDALAVSRYIQKTRPDRVFHLAGTARVGSGLQVKDYFGPNYLATVRLVEALGKLDKPVDIFVASSVHVYGNQNETVSETHPVQPVSPYGFSKYLAEVAVRHLCREMGNIRAVIGRLYTCIGPRQNEGFVIADLCRKIAALSQDADSVLQVGSLEARRHFMDVRDAVKILPALLKTSDRQFFEIVNIASPEPIQIKEALRRLLKVANRNPQIKSEIDTSNRFLGLTVSTKKLDRLLGANFFRPIDETLRDTYEWYSKN